MAGRRRENYVHGLVTLTFLFDLQTDKLVTHNTGGNVLLANYSQLGFRAMAEADTGQTYNAVSNAAS